MPQFFIPTGGNIGETVSLPPDQVHHLRDVLKGKAGETIRLFDPAGAQYQGQIQSVSKKNAVVLLTEKLSVTCPRGSLKIGQALLKREKMEFVVQKTAELGVARLLPFCSSRTVVHLQGDEKIRRWQKIADEACKQSGRARRMVVESSLPFEDRLKKIDADLKIIFWEKEGEPVRDFFRRGTNATTVVAFIGPEGGFSEEEMTIARETGFAVLSLGHNILRAETAAVAAATLIQYELENL